MANGNGANGTAGNLTRGGLTAATIYDIANPDTSRVYCMFNPEEYTISKTNKFDPVTGVAGKAPTMKFTESEVQTLGIDLIFDTYETGKSLLEITNKLWSFMAPKGKPPEPPEVAFAWGNFSFVAVIKTMSHQFTLFNKDGIPVRAKVHIDFQQSRDPRDYPKQNPSSGGGPVQRVWPVVGGDRIDLIAKEVYGDASKWRVIAEYNELDDPLHLQPGQELIIPEVASLNGAATLV